MSISSTICRLVSLKEESELFIDYYRMKLRKEFDLFPIYSDLSNKNWLVISGGGSLNASIAAIYLKNCSKSKLNTSWINFGFGLTNSNNFNCFVIDQIVENNTSEKLYPSIVNIDLFARSKIISFDKFKMSNDGLSDTNSFAFFKTMNKYVNKELLAIIKISINKDKYNDKYFKKSLIKKNFEKIIQVEKILKSYSYLESLNLIDVKYFDEIIKKIHFSVSQKFQLHNLLKSWNNFYSYNLLKKINKFSKADKVLEFLRSENDNGELNW